MRLLSLPLLCLSLALAAAAPPEVVPVPPPEPAKWAELKVPAGKLVVLSAQPASTWEPVDEFDLRVFESGKFGAFVLAEGRYKLVVTGPDGGRNRLVLVAGDAPPGPGPKPPDPPVDPLRAKLRAAYDADLAAKKVGDVQKLGDLYRAAAKFATAKDADGGYLDATLGEFLGRVQKGRDAFVGPAVFPAVRKAVGEELARAFPADGPLDDAARAKLADLFGRFAAALEGL